MCFYLDFFWGWRCLVLGVLDFLVYMYVGVWGCFEGWMCGVVKVEVRVV